MRFVFAISQPSIPGLSPLSDTEICKLLFQVSTDEMPSHSHTLNRNSNSSAGSNNWVLIDHEGATKWQTGDVGSAGGDAPHNNIQPVIAAFAWKRTA